MKLIKPSFEIIEQGNALLDVKKHIEKAARTCYKSENLITEDSAEKMYNRLVESKHMAMLEHGTVYLSLPKYMPCDDYVDNPYSKVESTQNYCYVTTNMRVLLENGWMDDLRYLCSPTDYHNKRITVKFITDQGVLREFTRHRSFSFAVESTRFCNYSKDKFGNEVTFIIPNWLKLREGSYTYEFPKGFTLNGRNFDGEIEFNAFLIALGRSEHTYLNLIENQGWKPEQARNVLPLATKCEIVMTGFVSDWRHFFALRAHGTTGTPHPQASELAIPLMNEFIKRELI